VLLQHARSAARVDADGELVPLPEQDRSTWDADELAEGLELLAHAGGPDRADSPGPYRLQAEIQAVHARARTADATSCTRFSIASARSKTERSAQPRHAALAAAIARSASSRVPSGRVPRLSPVAGLVASRRAPDSLSTHPPAIYMPCSTAKVSHQPIIRARTP